MNQPLNVAEYNLGVTKKAAEMLHSELELQRMINTYDEIKDNDCKTDRCQKMIETHKRIQQSYSFTKERGIRAI